MSRVSVMAARFRSVFQRGRLEGELDDEVRFHLEMQIEDNVKAGMTPSAARNAALRSFGGIEPMKETYRDRRAFTVLETTAQDFRYAVRTLRKSPGFTITSIAVLGLAIGANTAMFSVLNAVLLKPLPYRSPGQLTMLWSERSSQNVREGRSAFAEVEDWRRHTRSFSDIAVYDPASVTLTIGDQAQRTTVLRTTPNLLTLLDVRPAYGRSFTAGEAETRQRVALIGDRLWRSHFGASPEVLGKSILLDGMPSRIIGVLPPASQLTFLSDVWEPHTASPDWEAQRTARGPGAWFVLGRLQPAVTVERAQAEMSAIAQSLNQARSGPILDISVTPLSLTGRKEQLALWMLSGAVFLVLLVAATNVASLSLARAACRETEISVRAALGASRARILRQLLAESLTLASASGFLGIAIARLGIRLVLALRPGDLARLDQVTLDSFVLACAFGLCLVTGVVVGLVPALTLARRNLSSSGRQGRSIAGGVATRRIRRALVTAEFALAIVLLTGSGLLIRSLASVERVDPGFRPDRVLLVSLSAANFPPAQRADFYEHVLDEIRSLPGVERAGIIGDIFIGGNPERMVTIEGDSRAMAERLRLRSDEASEEFFQAVGAPLLRGRFFSRADGAGPPVALVNETMARRLWPGRDAVGRRFKLGGADSPAPWMSVVGVVGDMRRQGLEIAPIPQMFVPLRQNPSRLANLLVRTSTDDPLQISGAIQASVRGVTQHAAVYGIAPLETRLGGYLTERRFQTWLLIGFAIAALIIAAIGIYGLIQYSIATRTHEIGIRIAVGAQSGEIFRMILREGLKLSLTGLVFGLVAALGLGRASSSLLFGVSAADPLTFGGVSVLLTAVAMAACFFPARRAMNIDPMAALRRE